MRGFISGIGAIAFLLGLAGMAEAVTEHGSFLISAIVFSIGFGMSVATMGRTRK